MTYQIALCDDETAELDKTKELLNAYEKKHPGTDFMIERFVSAGELLYMVEEKSYAPDMIFMDIFMPGKDGMNTCLGMEAAKKLRDMGSRANLFFLTTSKEYALEAFDVDASQYLIKPVAEDKITYVLDRFLVEKEERDKYILLKIEGRIAKVAVKDIIYCEARGKIQCMYLADDREHLLRMTMTELYEMLSDYREFVRIGVAFIVNMEYIDSLNSQDICLTDGKKIYLPRGAYKTLKELYFRYYCGEE
ncbi:DNA-binding response regulator [Lachnospiraceae bacterium]|jgi:DNA-binding LytR/AlgR family response regulator|nr:DNA-binding response regulator [Lachnospiraceae bacterium]